jgi:tetratricopeptide (TPR) repeat protein
MNLRATDTVVSIDASHDNRIRAVVREEYARYQTNLEVLLVIAGVGLAFFGVILPIGMQKTHKKELDDWREEAKVTQQQHGEKLDTLIAEVTKKEEELKKLIDKNTRQLKALEAKAASRQKVQKTRELLLLKEHRYNLIEYQGTLMFEANKALKAGEYQKAITLYESAANEYHAKYYFSSEVEAYSNLAGAYWWSENYFKSLLAIDMAIKLQANMRYAPKSRHYYQRGAAFREMEQYGSALKEFNKAIEMEISQANRPGRLAKYHCGRAAALCAMEYFDDALADDDTAIRLCEQALQGYLREPHVRKNLAELLPRLYLSRACTHEIIAATKPNLKTKHENLAQADKQKADTL